MVVDDSHDMVTVLKGLLESKGYSVQCAHSAEEMFNQMEQQKPDLIILDIMMPDVDGLEALVRLKEVSATCLIPVILLTARHQYEDVLKGYNVGANYFITKPFTSNQLLNGITLFLSERNPTLHQF
jgi:DNA-binding response OmpR family regulator